MISVTAVTDANLERGTVHLLFTTKAWGNVNILWKWFDGLREPTEAEERLLKNFR